MAYTIGRVSLFCPSFSLFFYLSIFYFWQGVPMEAQPSKLVGSIGCKNRYFDFDKLAEV